MSVPINDLIQLKRIVAESMSILQTVLDSLPGNEDGGQVTTPDQELRLDSETLYGNSEELLHDIQAIFANIPPWDEAVTQVEGA